MRDRSKITALEFFLCKFPEHPEGSESVYDLIQQDESYIANHCVIWEPYEDQDCEWLKKQILALAETIDQEIDHALEEIKTHAF